MVSKILAYEGRRKECNFLKIRKGHLTCWVLDPTQDMLLLFNSQNNPLQSHYSCHFTVKENRLREVS